MNAAMEGQQAIVARIGKPVKLSEMELICLVNFAEIGLMSLFCAIDGETGKRAEADLDRTIDAIRREFESHGEDGLSRLSTAAAAILRSEKFAKYLAR